MAKNSELSNAFSAKKQKQPIKPAKSFNYRIISFILATIFGIAFSVPSFFQGAKEGSFFYDKPKIVFGLDLQGGLSVLLSIDLKEAIKNKYSAIASSINFQAKNENILLVGLKSTNNNVSFNILDSTRRQDLDSILKNIQGLEVSRDNNKFLLTLSKEEISKVRQDALNQSISTIRNRLDKFGLSEPSVSRQGLDKISVEIPGVKSLQDQERLINLITKSAKLELMAVDEDRNANVASLSQEQAASYGDVILPYEQGSTEGFSLLLKAVPILDGSMLSDASSGINPQSGEAIVSFTLNSTGAKIFADFSASSINKRMAIVLDRKIISAPVIRERIGGGSGQISGSFTSAGAHDLAITLRSGALLAPVSVIEKRSVGPSLGEDSIKASFIALGSGFILVVGFMIIYYSMAGLIACIAMVVNLLLIIAIMSLFGATLTLPGMAGIVLTVGMAVDANIIINERIREGLREGLKVTKALKTGYENASRAIFDANITGLIASLLLYIYGTGAIKGFAITTGIGILASILTAIIGTHGVYLWLGKYIERKDKIYFWFGVSYKKKEVHGSI